MRAAKQPFQPARPGSSGCTQHLQLCVSTEIMRVVKRGPSLAPAVANRPVKICFVQAIIFLNGRKVIFILDKTQRCFFFFFART